MDGINSWRSAGKPVQYGKFTFLDISHKLEQSDEPVNMDGWTRYDNSLEHRKEWFRPFFSSEALSASPLVSTAKRDVDQQTKEAIQQFFDGKLSEDSLAERFKSLSKQLSDVCRETGYPIVLWDAVEAQTATECFYSEFRRSILEVALERNNQEGKQYVTGTMNTNREYKYYNADYYYQSEAAISAITKGVLELADEAGYQDFTLPDYKGENLYYNFNSAFCNRFVLSEQYMLDVDKAPPENFKWFYQSGGETNRGISFVARPVEDDIEIDQPVNFDPTDFKSATMWASFRDVNGKEHKISHNLLYNLSASDLYDVGSLMKFSTGNSKQDAGLNSFLHNLQVYRMHYFSAFAQKNGIDIYI